MHVRTSSGLEENPALAAMFDEVDFEMEMEDPFLIFPHCLDVNGDGDPDLLLEVYEDSDVEPGYFVYYEKLENGFVEIEGAQNPFDGVDLPPLITFPSITFGNIDGDGFLNLYVSLKDEEILYCFDTTVPQPPPCNLIPTVSQWGLILLGLVLMILGTVGVSTSTSASSSAYRK